MSSSRSGGLPKKTEGFRSVPSSRGFSRINRITSAGIRKKKLETQVEGEIETEHSEYLKCQDTYYVDTIKGVGKIL